MELMRGRAFFLLGSLLTFLTVKAAQAGRLHPSGYWAVNPAVSYVPPWNERVRLTLTAAIYGGHNKFGFPGLLSEKDSIFLKMRYQF